ncbi:MAG: carboxynorspermidine decarboxylase [Akkermansiaceae bacterium]
MEDILEICHRQELPTPCHLQHRGLLEKNLRIFEHIHEHTGGHIILALKGYATHSTFPQIARVLKGTTASSINEAKLGIEKFGGEIHVYCVAYKPEEFRWLSTRADHITLNSLTQWQQLRELAASPDSTASYGLRINPEYSEVETSLYNPCRPGTRFGVTAAQLNALGEDALEGIDGLHFHSMCEQGADTLARTLDRLEVKFGNLLTHMKWLNMGGGHHITRPGYDIDLLCQCITHMKKTYNLDIYMEPGEAVALNTGFLVSSVVDRFRAGDGSGTEIAILDTSASAHMPDVLEMPYRPDIIGTALPQEKAHTITLGGLTCLAGDIIGDYSFDKDLQIGDRLVFTDMAHYSMVKNTTFNGVNLPSIANYDPKTDSIDLVKEFGYDSYRDRLS